MPARRERIAGQTMASRAHEHRPNTHLLVVHWLPERNQPLAIIGRGSLRTQRVRATATGGCAAAAIHGGAISSITVTATGTTAVQCTARCVLLRGRQGRRRRCRHRSQRRGSRGRKAGCECFRSNRSHDHVRHVVRA